MSKPKKGRTTVVPWMRSLPDCLRAPGGSARAKVTQRSRGGDGYGLLRLSPLVSLRVAFQGKCHRDVVTRSAVGEFRNALLGRAEKGVFATTGRFTTDAEGEATRDGVVPVELIDGERLVKLFRMPASA